MCQGCRDFQEFDAAVDAFIARELPRMIAEHEASPAVGCLRCGGGVVGVEGRYQCRCGWAAPTTQSGLDEFHPESTMNPEEPK